jgi:hypothetical protein
MGNESSCKQIINALGQCIAIFRVCSNVLGFVSVFICKIYL